MDNNIEKKIKEDFSNRTVKPSANAWMILDAKLDLQTSKKKNKKIIFFTYAAVFVGLLFGLSYFIKAMQFDTKKDVEVVKKTINKKSIDFGNKSKVKQVVETKPVIVKKILPPVIKKEIFKTSKSEVTNKFKSKNTWVSTSKLIELVKKPNTNTKLNTTKNNNLVLVNDNTKQPNTIVENVILKQVPITKLKLFSVTNQDIDILLATAMNEVNTNKTNYTIVVNKEDLTNNIKTTIKTSFKTKILKTILTGVDTVENFIVSNN